MYCNRTSVAGKSVKFNYQSNSIYILSFVLHLKQGVFLFLLLFLLQARLLYFPFRSKDTIDPFISFQTFSGILVTRSLFRNCYRYTIC